MKHAGHHTDTTCTEYMYVGCIISTGDDIDMNMEIGNWTFNALILQNSKAPKV